MVFRQEPFSSMTLFTLLYKENETSNLSSRTVVMIKLSRNNESFSKIIFRQNNLTVMS
jgi:hypothetical protein